MEKISETKIAFSVLNSTQNCGFIVCTDSKGNLYAARNFYPYNSKLGDLAKWNTSAKKWDSLGGNFDDTVNAVCTDSNGNIYVVGDFKDSNGDCCIAKYNPITKEWTSFSNKLIQFPINLICCNSNDTIYITGNFIDRNENDYVVSINLTNGNFKELLGNRLKYAISDMCIDESDNLWILMNYPNSDNSRTCYLQNWNGSEWSNQITNSRFGSLTTNMCCDRSGNLYLPSGNTGTIIKYIIATNSIVTIPVQVINKNTVILYLFVNSKGDIHVMGLCFSGESYLYIYHPISRKWGNDSIHLLKSSAFSINKGDVVGIYSSN